MKRNFFEESAVKAIPMGVNNLIKIISEDGINTKENFC
jgi:hypothetical protein